MSTKNLKFLFEPASIAVIGASNRPNAVGHVVMKNLLQGGFKGPIMPVNPKHEAISGVLAYPDVASLPTTPELAVICIPPKGVAQAIEQLCARGTRAAVVLTAGLGDHLHDESTTIKQAMLDIAKQHGMRILGPNCLGLMVPGHHMNASFAHIAARPGKIAFVSQSGALCTAVLDWAHPRNIGFSHFISLGDMNDTDFGDVLDYLGSDPHTSAILLYIEAIYQNRRFMSAARAAARNKPVLALKSGRVAEGAKAAASHTGALAGSDAVYDAAFRRAGMLRVYEFEELFAAVETLGRGSKTEGERLAIVTNGGGFGVLAVDELIEMGGKLAELSDKTMEKLNAVLPPTWSKGNPIDTIGDADDGRYYETLNVLMEAKEVDAILCMHSPVAVVDPLSVAQRIIQVAKEHPKANILTSFVGEQAVASSRHAFTEAGIPTFETPGKAVQAFMHTVRYHRNQDLLMETPDSLPSAFKPAVETARLIVENAIASGHEVMSEPESKAVMAAYGIPTVETHVAKTPELARTTAEHIGYPVVVKILSPEASHKSDVGGVALNLHSGNDVEKAARRMLDKMAEKHPDATISGFSVQKMASMPGAHELIIGVVTDPIFGPVILFGDGGTAVEIIDDSAIALPPLNANLAKDLISRTRVSKLLKGYRDRPAADLDAIVLTLNQVAQLIIDIPEIVELDINPLLVNADGVLVLDARIKVEPTASVGSARLAIRPYPMELESPFTMKDGREVLLRPIRPEDEPNHHVFISRLTPEDIRYRFFGAIRELPHSQMARLTQIDYDRDMAFIATAPTEDNRDYEILGVVRTLTDAENKTAEFSIVVRSDQKGTGLAQGLMEKMIAYCRGRGTEKMIGQVLSDNSRMLHFVERLGFKRTGTIDNTVAVLEFDLQD